jgi:hypothetical protein
MKFKIFFLILIFIITSRASSGEKQSIHLTGNRTVDFFGSSKQTLPLSSGDRSSLNYLQMPRSNDNEKSPWLASLLSLAVPGAGEVYSESYLKGAIFFGVEVGSWITTLIYNKKGNDQTTKFENYANEHYSVVRYAQWVLRNLKDVEPNKILDPTYYGNKIFNPNPPDENAPPPFACVNWSALNGLEREIVAFTHQLPYYNQQQYYELIGKYKQFSKGWDSQIGDDANFKEGNPQFYMYGEMFNKADKYYKVADAFISVIVVNHILSALDAAWTATKYNKSLHASVRMQMYDTPYGYLPGVEANLQYSF